MKKKILLLSIMFLGIFVLTGCGKEEGESSGGGLFSPSAKEITNPFTLTCESVDTSAFKTKVVTTSTYNFNKEQMLLNYSIVTKSTFEEDEVYKANKKRVVEDSKNNKDTNTSVNTDDATKTITNVYKELINEEKINAIQDKEYYKAPNVLKRVEVENTTCTFSGVDRDQIK